MNGKTEQLSLVSDEPDAVDVEKIEAAAQSAVDTLLATRADPETDDFDWSSNNEDVLMPEQRQIAVYTNSWGAAVIRQERRWPEEDQDPYIMVDHAHLPKLIDALQNIAKRPMHRAEPEPGKATGGSHLD